MIGKAINGLLLSTSAITNLVSTRIYPQFNPKAARPSIVYRQDAVEVDRHYTGGGGLQQVTTTITAVADTYDSADTLADLIATAFESQAGTWGGIVVLGAFVDDTDEIMQMIDGGTDQPLYGRSLTVIFWIKPS